MPYARGEKEVNPEKIKEDVIDIICEIGTLNPREIHDHTTLDQLGLDSLDITEISMEIENLYEINLDEISIAELKDHTLQSIINIIEEKI